MKKRLLCCAAGLLLLFCSLAGCGTRENTDEPVALSEQKLGKLQTFLNDPVNNGFVGSLHEYAAPQKIDLRLVLYDGAGIGRQYDELSETEQQAVQNTPNYSDLMPCVVFKVSDIENYLQKKVGISLADVTKGTDGLDYVKEHDLYFLQKTDTNLMSVTVTGATVDKNNRYLVQYTDTVGNSGNVTLRKAAEGYQFISNTCDHTPHSAVDPADLTDEQAQEILALLVPKQVEIFGIFQLDYTKIDATQTCPWDEKYVLCTDERFACVQDIKDFILTTMTESAAQEYFFDVYLDGPYDPPEDVNYYIDYEGKLYRSTYAEGKGFSTNYLIETAHIVERTHTAVTLQMDTLWGAEPSDFVYTPTLVKTQNGWRIDNRLDEGYYLSA